MGRAGGATADMLALFHKDSQFSKRLEILEGALSLCMKISVVGSRQI